MNAHILRTCREKVGDSIRYGSIIVTLLFIVMSLMSGFAHASSVSAADVQFVTSSSIALETSGCFVRTSNGTKQSYTVRMQTPSCTVTVNNSSAATEIITIHIENIDPDYVDVDNYDSSYGLVKTKNTLDFQYTVEPGASTTTIAPWYSYGDDFNFVALSDNQARGTIDVNPVLTQMLPEVNTVNPPFFTNSGDVVQGSRRVSTMQLMFEKYLEALQELTVPSYLTAGNHDYDVGLDTFRSYLGGTDYSFDFGNTHFTFFSTIVSRLHGAVDEAQLTWLENELSSTEQSNSIVFFHHPVSAPSWAKTNQYYIEPENNDQLTTLLDNQQIDLSINGHAHGYDYRFLTSDDAPAITQGYNQLITGGAGGNLGQPNGQHHFVIVHVTPDEITHTRVNLEEFNTVVEYANNNGKKRVATAEVSNEADQDLPYVRLKFKLNTPLENVLISDQDGNYYSNYYSHAFEEYTVVYFETNAPANSVTTYTAQAATVLHSDIVNTINADGQVTWSEMPGSVLTAAPNIQVLPSQLQTEIAELNFSSSNGRVGYEWLETPATSDSVTTYTIDQLSPFRQYLVRVNNEVYSRYTASADGEVTFQYTDTTTQRRFQFTQIDPMYSANVVSVPFQGGTPHVRMFAPNGTLLSSWFSLSSTNTGSFAIQQARTDDVNTDRILVSTLDFANPLISVFSQAGDRLSDVTPFSASNADQGLSVATGDLTGNNLDEIAVTAKDGSGLVKIYRYAKKSAKLKQITRKRLFGKNFSGTPVVKIANLDDDPSAELVTIDQYGSTKALNVFTLSRKNKLKKIASTNLPRSFVNADIEIGYFAGTVNPQIAVLTKKSDEGSGQLYIYSYEADGLNVFDGGNLIQRAHTKIKSTPAGALQILSARLTSHFKDQLIVTGSESGQLVGYTYNGRYRPKQLFKKSPFGKTYAGGVHLSTVNQNGDSIAELVTAQLTGDSQVADWEYARSTGRMNLIARWQPYGSGFTGGVHMMIP